MKKCLKFLLLVLVSIISACNSLPSIISTAPPIASTSITPKPYTNPTSFAAATSTVTASEASPTLEVTPETVIKNQARNLDFVQKNVDAIMSMDTAKLEAVATQYGYKVVDKLDIGRAPVLRTLNSDGKNSIVMDVGYGPNLGIITLSLEQRDNEKNMVLLADIQGIDLGTFSLTDSKANEYYYLVTGHLIGGQKIILPWWIGVANEKGVINGLFAINDNPSENGDGYRYFDERITYGGASFGLIDAATKLNRGVGKVVAIRLIDGRFALHPFEAISPEKRRSHFSGYEDLIYLNYIPEFNEWAEKFSDEHDIEDPSAELLWYGNNTEAISLLMNAYINSGFGNGNARNKISSQYPVDQGALDQVGYERLVELARQPSIAGKDVLALWSFPGTWTLKLNTEDLPLPMTTSGQ